MFAVDLGGVRSIEAFHSKSVFFGIKERHIFVRVNGLSSKAVPLYINDVATMDVNKCRELSS